MPTTKFIEAIPTDQELIQRRRAQLARAALSVFAKQGFHKTRVREIAKEAGVAVGTIQFQTSLILSGILSSSTMNPLRTG